MSEIHLSTNLCPASDRDSTNSKSFLCRSVLRMEAVRGNCRPRALQRWSGGLECFLAFVQQIHLLGEKPNRKHPLIVEEMVHTRPFIVRRPPIWRTRGGSRSIVSVRVWYQFIALVVDGGCGGRRAICSLLLRYEGGGRETGRRGRFHWSIFCFHAVKIRRSIYRLHKSHRFSKKLCTRAPWAGGTLDCGQVVSYTDTRMHV